jgi:acetyl esterase
MPLDPQAQALLDQVAASGAPPLTEMSPADARQFMEALNAASGPGPDLPLVEDVTIPATDGPVMARVYRPSTDAPLPVLVWFHGGGWVIGSVAGSDATCRHLAQRSGVAVVSVEYRLAPEHPFPAGARDCYDALRWVVDHASELGLDAGRVAVGGDSAGGNLSAAVTLIAADRGGPAVHFQLLVYPATDLLCSYPSHHENGDGYLLTSDAIKWFTDHYLSGEENDAKDKLVSPIYADETELAQLPAALVITAEYDPLRDEGEAYAKRLEQAGVPAQTIRVPGQIHGFFGMVGVMDAADVMVTEAAEALRQALA